MHNKSKIKAIIKLQQFLYELLTNSELATAVQIYHQIPKNSSLPYIYLGKFSSNFVACSGVDSIEMNQQLQIYSRNNDNSEILNWADEVSSLLELRNVTNGQIKIKFIKFDSMDFDVMPDAKIFRLIMHFKIKMEVILNEYNQSLISFPQNQR